MQVGSDLGEAVDQLPDVRMNVIHAAQAGPVSIACINQAMIDLDVPFDKLTTTLQKCYDQHFLPIWGCPVKFYNTKVAKKDRLAVHLFR
jgi:hypothetical protein